MSEVPLYRDTEPALSAVAHAINTVLLNIQCFRNQYTVLSSKINTQCFLPSQYTVPLPRNKYTVPLARNQYSASC
jgi:hypothetical protein